MARKKSIIHCIISATKWLPCVVVFAMFGWGVYAYTVPFAFKSLESTWIFVTCLAVFYSLYLLSLWSYVQTIMASPGTIPGKFYLTPEICEELAQVSSELDRNRILTWVANRNELPISCKTYNGGIRFCEKCNLIKPDRCHHCSICDVCVLKMDHHCPWINNCVSFNNYKFFVLFLGYTFFLCIWVGSTTFPYFIKFWSMPDLTPKGQPQDIDEPSNPTGSIKDVPFSLRFHILFLFFIACMLSIGLMFLYCYHIYLIMHNRSTLESFRPPLMQYGPDKNAFNLGKKENFRQLFGRSKLLCLLPVFTTEGTGLAYDQRPQIGGADEEARQELLNHNSHPNNHAKLSSDTEV